MTAPVCVPLGPGFEPGSAKWLTTVSASKIAAIAGVSPFQSRESLLLQMSGLEAPTEPTEAMLLGQRAEPWIRDLVSYDHPEWSVTVCGGYARADEPRFIATPDGLIDQGDGAPVLLEIKRVGSVLEWDRHGVPLHYRAQAQWQMYVTGYGPVLFAVSDPVRLGRLQHRELVVPRDDAFIGQLVRAARKFLIELGNGTEGI